MLIPLIIIEIKNISFHEMFVPSNDYLELSGLFTGGGVQVYWTQIIKTSIPIINVCRLNF